VESDSQSWFPITERNQGINNQPHLRTPLGGLRQRSFFDVSGFKAGFGRKLFTEIDIPLVVQGFSGSVMCLGRSIDPTARALLFQNYDTPIKPEHVKGKVTDEWNPIVKAGFL
jgi:hypothetical protein